MSENDKSVWDEGDAYEPYVGRWSRMVAPPFLEWLGLPPGMAWMDVGCGTGALTQVILERCSPAKVLGVDPSEGYLGLAENHTADGRATFELGNSNHLPGADSQFDVAVSGLVLNFMPDKKLAMSEMMRVVKSGGTIAAYIWDYAGKMELMRYFWDSAVELNPDARKLDEGVRFPIANPDLLFELYGGASLAEVETKAIDVPTVFRDFDDYWLPFLGGQFPAPDYCMSLSEENRTALQNRVYSKLPIAKDGSISLIARALAVKGIVQK